MRFYVKPLYYFLLIFCIVFNNLSFAQAVATIEDAEIEAALDEVLRPIIKVARLNHREMKVHLIVSKDINAFVIDGKNIFLSTGLLMFSDSPEALAGVIAHECGHIAKGHVSARRAEIENLQKKSALVFLTGLAASIATSSDVGLGAIAMGQEFFQQKYLSYSRIQEAAADKAAVDYMRKLNLPTSGLLQILGNFNEHDRIFYADIAVYKRTHPSPTQRLEFLRQHSSSLGGNSYLTDAAKNRFKRAVFKLRAFLLPADETLLKLKNNEDPASRYAQAIAYYKKFNITKAIELLDKLITHYPNNAYYLETKAQFLMEVARVNEAVTYYQKAAALHPQSRLLQAGLANAYILAPNSKEAQWKKAVQILEKLALSDENNYWIFRRLGLAYGKLNDSANSYLALALEQYLLDEKEKAKKFLRSAQAFNEKKNNNSPRFKQRMLELSEILS